MNSLEFVMQYYQILKARRPETAGQEFLAKLPLFVKMNEVDVDIEQAIMAIVLCTFYLDDDKLNEFVDFCREIGKTTKDMPKLKKNKCTFVKETYGDPCSPRTRLVCKNKSCTISDCPMKKGVSVFR